MKIAEVITNEAKTAEQLRIDALKRKRDAAADELEAERNRQKERKAVEKLMQARRELLLGEQEDGIVS